jgi:hypothetical protein
MTFAAAGRWLSNRKLGPVEDRSDYMRRGTLYEAFNSTVIKHVLDVLVPTLERVMNKLLPPREKTEMPSAAMPSTLRRRGF